MGFLEGFFGGGGCSVDLEAGVRRVVEVLGRFEDWFWSESEELDWSGQALTFLLLAPRYGLGM